MRHLLPGPAASHALSTVNSRAAIGRNQKQILRSAQNDVSFWAQAANQAA